MISDTEFRTPCIIVFKLEAIGCRKLLEPISCQGGNLMVQVTGFCEVGEGEFWLGGRDSNPDSQIQSLESYHWTTSQQRNRIYELKPRKSTAPQKRTAPSEFTRNSVPKFVRESRSIAKKVLALQAAGKHNTRLATSHHRRPSRLCF